MTEPLVDVTGARRRRARERLKRRLTLAGILLGVLALVVGGVWAVYGSPWLAARDVRVEGNVLTPTEQVVAVAGVPLGTPLASLDTAGIESRVREGAPAVDTVTASRTWPSTVTIRVTEWSPRIVIGLPGAWVWIAADGRAFHTTPDRPDGVMEARGSLADEHVLATLATVADSLPPAVRADAEHIQAGTVDSVTITLKDRRRIVWGSAEDADLKGRVLVPLLKVDAKEYDVSAPTHPTTR